MDLNGFFAFISTHKYIIFKFSMKKASQIKILRFLEPLIDFKLNLKICNSGLKAFKKFLCMKRELFYNWGKIVWFTGN
jgi:hypothetical protein